jgi:heme ABC exporter ATP-binding subunit CcmA
VQLEFDRVEAKGLVKVFGATRALAGVDLHLSAGRITALEGHNGSGKSTLLQLLALLARPTRGEIRFGRYDARTTPALRARIGMLAHSAMVYPDLTAHENLALCAELYGISTRDHDVLALTERFGLGSWAQRPARTYSRGQLQRLSLARAVLHKPQLLLLDEPSTGLDVGSVERLVTAIQAERARGAIVVLVTHDRVLSERLADTRIELRQGRLAPVASPSASAEVKA